MFWELFETLLTVFYHVSFHNAGNMDGNTEFDEEYCR